MELYKAKIKAMGLRDKTNSISIWDKSLLKIIVKISKKELIQEAIRVMEHKIELSQQVLWDKKK